MSKWKTPPTIKIYEALGAIADNRVLPKKGNLTWVYSSSGRKHYDVEYEPASNSITSNDNGSYWKMYLGYPAIAVLMSREILPFSKEISSALAGIKWKDVNKRFNNDIEKTEKYILDHLTERGFRAQDVKIEIDHVMSRINELGLERLGATKKPPEGY